MGLLALAQWYVEMVQNVTKDVDFFKFSRISTKRTRAGIKRLRAGSKSRNSAPTTRTPTARSTPLSAAGTIKRAGLDDALDKRAHDAAKVEAAESLDAKLERLKQEQLTPEQRMVKEILANPGAVHAYVELAEIYRNRGDLDKAEKVLAKGLKANADDQGLMAIYEDTQISRLKRAVEAQSQRVLQHPEDTAAKAKLDQVTDMLSKYEIEAFRRRVTLHPEDAAPPLSVWRHPGKKGRSRRCDCRVPASSLQSRS